jgi:hypothetical protein
MAVTLHIHPLAFAACPVLLTLNTGSSADKTYKIYSITNTAGTDVEQLVFSGVVNTLGLDLAIDISFVFYEYKYTASVTRYKVVFDETGQNLISYFKIYGGGISKLALRMYTSAYSFIQSRLQVTTRNFFLTNRSSSQFLFIPENELTNLYFYSGNTNKQHFYIKYNSQTIATYNFAGQSLETLEYIDLQALRAAYFAQSGKLVSMFDVFSATDSFLFSIVITQAQKANCFLRFQNAFGCTEKIALLEQSNYTPTIEAATKKTIFDPLVADFIAMPERSVYTNTYLFNISLAHGLSTAFLLDMLSSNNIFLEVPYSAGVVSHRVSVTAASELVFNKLAQTITVKVTIVDTETVATVLDDALDYSLLQVNGPAYFSANGSVVLIS